MAKNDRGSNAKFEKGGYRPLNVGYTPKELKGYSSRSQVGKLPKAPQGGTGESSRPAAPAGSVKAGGQ